jgi:hypothetical protein
MSIISWIFSGQKREDVMTSDTYDFEALQRQASHISCLVAFAFWKHQSGSGVMRKKERQKGI